MMRVQGECLCSCWLELPQPELLAPALSSSVMWCCSPSLLVSCVWEWDGHQSAGDENLYCASLVFLGFNSFFPVIIIFYFMSFIKLFLSPPTNFIFFQFSSPSQWVVWGGWSELCDAWMQGKIMTQRNGTCSGGAKQPQRPVGQCHTVSAGLCQETWGDTVPAPLLHGGSTVSVHCIVPSECLLQQGRFSFSTSAGSLAGLQTHAGCSRSWQGC